MLHQPVRTIDITGQVAPLKIAFDHARNGKGEGVILASSVEHGTTLIVGGDRPHPTGLCKEVYGSENFNYDTLG